MSPRLEKRILGSGPKLMKKMETEPMRLVPENVVKFSVIKQYPYLNEGDRRVKFNPFTGEIYISTYRHKVKGEAEREQLEGEVVLMQRGRKPSQEVLLRWNQYPDIEQAIRGAEHILDRYGKEEGSMVTNTLGVIGLTRSLLRRFEHGEVKKENIDQIAQETSLELAKLGFKTAEKPIRQRLADQIARAAGTDKRQRINPLVSRTRLASAWLKATRELLVAKKVREKFSGIYADLSGERDFERLCLGQAANLMQEASSSERVADLKSKVDALKEYCSEFFTPRVVKVAPYRRPALLSAYSLFGLREGDDAAKRLLVKMLGSEQMAHEILSLKPIDKILAESKDADTVPAEVQARLITSLAGIDNALEQGRKNLEPKNHPETLDAT